ncbi:MAG: hypothetical protein JW787_09140 [Sedimentisphaerales bacterium]|nr:hypothetical protein [Sedimentisphaerales bacterium]
MLKGYNIKFKDWIRWLGVGSSLAILFIIALDRKGEMEDPFGAVVLLVLGLLPVFVYLFASLARRFWINLIVGLWYLLVGVLGSYAFVLLFALSLSSTPILNRIFGKTMSIPYQPSDFELQGAPDAFKYEMEMLYFAHGQLLNESGGLHNVMIECTLLHARNLLDFFTGNQPMTGKMDEKSIRAGQYIKENTWWKSNKLSYLQQRKKDINKALSHLTYDRIGTKYKWDLEKITDQVEIAYTEFLKLLPDIERSKWPSLENSGTT